ncbi:MULTISPECIES: helix-turn-helix domain-containing protein [Bifidobacterium]|uniref:Transcriptional regulator n=2 Tax=Bifidobacterium TaxID=1678 RepID=A0A2M9HQ84_9BIFI|nr:MULTISPECIES: helix-turn-helix domain-containing protein [Bifidobacterium]KFI50750.1 toxin-antitoxin system, antitoxin component, Xre family [Bifidobacterium biavatii DSM 23969]PJM78984.1 transcriptional regulator [Bifidobacterium scaligerum]
MSRTSASAACALPPVFAVDGFADASRVLFGRGVVPQSHDTRFLLVPASNRGISVPDGQGAASERELRRDGVTTRRVRMLMGEPNYVSYAALARIMRLSKSSVTGKLNGDINWTLPDIRRIASHFRVSSDWLLGLSDDPVPSTAKEVVAFT